MVTHVRAALEAALRRPFKASNMIGVAGERGYVVFSKVRGGRGRWSDLSPVLAYGPVDPEVTTLCFWRQLSTSAMYGMNSADFKRFGRLISRVQAHLQIFEGVTIDPLSRVQMSEFAHLCLHGESVEKWAI